MASAFDGSACPAKVFGHVSPIAFTWSACALGKSCHSIQQER